MSDKVLYKNICENLDFTSKEAFRRLRTNLLITLSEMKDDNCCVIGISSARPAEGKTTVAINTAYSLAELNKRVLLIDADLRRPTVHKKLDLPQIPGLNELLTGTNEIGNIIRTYKSRTADVSFDILTAGVLPENPAEILASVRMEKLINVLKSAFDYIILDFPPVGAVVDAISALKYTDGVIVVVRENNCPEAVFDDCIEQLRFAGAMLLGVVMNGTAATAESGKKNYYLRYK